MVVGGSWTVPGSDGVSVYYSAPYMGTTYLTHGWCNSPWFNTWKVDVGHLGINNVYPQDKPLTVSITYIIEFGF